MDCGTHTFHNVSMLRAKSGNLPPSGLIPQLSLSKPLALNKIEFTFWFSHLPIRVTLSKYFLLLELHFPPEYNENISTFVGCHED